MTMIFLIVEWIGREQQYAIEHLGTKWYKPLRWAMYYAIILAIFHFTGKEQQFIYFQF
jgi:alginate O-acetyltransferase complex protein AlgI